MSLLTFLFVRNSHILTEIYFIFLIRYSTPNLEKVSIPRLGLILKKWLSSKTNFSTFLQIICFNFMLNLCQRY